MNSTKLKTCLTLLQSSNNLLSCHLLKSISKCSVIHISERSYYLDFILGGSKLIFPPAMKIKRDENTSFQSFSFLESFKVRQERRIKIRDTLQCTSTDAREILHCAIAQSSLDDQEIFFEKLESLRRAGLDAKLILNNTWLLNVSLGELENKLETFSSRSSKEFHDISLLKLSRSELKDLMIRLKDDEVYSMETRIDFFSREFDMSVAEVCDLLVERSFLRKKHLHEIISTYKLLTGHGVTTSEVKTDFWVFRFSKETISRRINVAKSLKLDHFKCWMIRCSLCVLRRSAEICNNNKKALEMYPSKDTFLMNKLQINEEELNDIFLKYPAIKKVSESKLKLMIDFLLSENFTPQQIRRCPRIICYSLLTMQERLKEVRSLDYDIQSLYVLIKNSKNYKVFIKILQARKETNLEKRKEEI